jgi:hypothetical protein
MNSKVHLLNLFMENESMQMDAWNNLYCYLKNIVFARLSILFSKDKLFSNLWMK